ncbi:MAG: hypothetical protein Kow0065_21690 [Methylomicrobium sp.]
MKLFACSIALALLLGSNQASAHAVVTDHSLKIEPIKPHRAAQVALSFNSKIEVGLSQVFLVKAGDEHVLLAIEPGERQGQLVVAIPALEPGDYAIRLKVLATDGHLTEDIIHFTVLASE